jgi:hypothetical protein
MTWYRYWVRYQANSVPTEVRNLVISQAAGSVDPLPMIPSSEILELFLRLAFTVKATREISLDKIIQTLQRFIQTDPSNTANGQQLCRSLTLSVLAWQTMLWAPSLDTCSPLSLSISNPDKDFRSPGLFRTEQPQKEARHPLYEFLFGFGELFPVSKRAGNADIEGRRGAEKFATAIPGELNSYLLREMGDLSIRWSDVIQPHLELDEVNRVLFLFRYPSFAASCLPSQTDGDASAAPSVLHS